MPFIPHTEQDIQAMLKTIGVSNIAQLFDEIPDNLLVKDLPDIPESLTEIALSRLMKARAASDGGMLCFIGAGAYEHHVPAAVWEVTGRGEFLTAYTPYQAEASQGTLQLLYEYQTMMASLMGLDVSNASLYEGATALAEAILMAARSNKKSHSHTILLPETIHPHYRTVVKTIARQQDIKIIEIPFDKDTGTISEQALYHCNIPDITALVIPQPNFFGQLEKVDTLTDWAHDNGALVIGVVNPLAMSLLRPPGQWGKKGADIACGDGQPLGIPLASGGPYYGFLCCKQEFVRQLPGRIVGRTLDKEGKQGFVLTLQAREQHIRRSKATSNICTNQGLLVTASTIYMSLVGPMGLRQVATTSHHNLIVLEEYLQSIAGLQSEFTGLKFHETVVKLPVPVEDVLVELAKAKVQGGFAIEAYYPTLKNCLLICVTETKTAEDIQRFVQLLADVIESLKKNNNDAPNFAHTA